MLDSRNSGLLHGSGVRRSRPRRSVIKGNALRHQIPDIHITDQSAIRAQVWDFDPQWEFEYSKRELMLMTEKILLEDPKPPDQYPAWLPARQYMERLKREIYTADGIPDPSVASGFYWRTHPQGRKFHTKKQMTKRGGGNGFYK